MFNAALCWKKTQLLAQLNFRYVYLSLVRVSIYLFIGMNITYTQSLLITHCITLIMFLVNSSVQAAVNPSDRWAEATIGTASLARVVSRPWRTPRNTSSWWPTTCACPGTMWTEPCGCTVWRCRGTSSTAGDSCTWWPHVCTRYAARRSPPI